MNNVSLQTTNSDEVLLAALAHLNKGNINNTIACFASEPSLKDHGLGLEFTDSERLGEFFDNQGSSYPDSLVLRQVFVSGNHVIARWTLEPR